ncbi:MAG: hypothetical protein U0797_07135 [Gemmataceae bacterium]
MRTPRRTSYRRFALTMGLVTALAGPAQAALAPIDLRIAPQRSAQVGKIAAPVIPICLVVQAPIKPTDYAKAAFDQPGFPAENPTGTPEPASLITGLLGGGVALTAWARRRRQGQGLAEDGGGPTEFGDVLEAA